jgi:D-alanyl-D-alanine carboxypeptidase
MKRKLIIAAFCLAGLLTLAALAACSQTPPDDDGKTQEDPRVTALADARDKGLLILVNKQNPVDESYVPEDLAAIKYYANDRPASSRFLRAEAAEAFNRMAEEAAAQGIDFVMTTAYRSYAFQKQLFDSYVAKNGLEEASRFSAKPGQSEHQTGLAVDVSCAAVDYQLVYAFGETEEGLWLAANAADYGFIIRYPDGAEDLTGYLYEPWHLRYVGVFIAKEIKAEGVVFETWLDENKTILQGDES